VEVEQVLHNVCARVERRGLAPEVRVRTRAPGHAAGAPWMDSGTASSTNTAATVHAMK
jgi:hypothetical protein